VSVNENVLEILPQTSTLTHILFLHYCKLSQLLTNVAQSVVNVLLRSLCVTCRCMMVVWKCIEAWKGRHQCLQWHDVKGVRETLVDATVQCKAAAGHNGSYHGSMVNICRRHWWLLWWEVNDLQETLVAAMGSRDLLMTSLLLIFCSNIHLSTFLVLPLYEMCCSLSSLTLHVCIMSLQCVLRI
jgi:hypothetical protein